MNRIEMNTTQTRRNRVRQMATPPPSMKFPNVKTAVTTARSARNYQMAHSKSRVANVLSKPGQVVYTNKERIEKEYQNNLERISSSFGVSMEELSRGLEASKEISQKEAVSTLKKLEDSIEEAIRKNPKAATVTIAISIGTAQLAFKAMRVMIAAFVFMLALPFSISNMFDGLPHLMNEILPDTSFNTTRHWINWVKGKSN